MKIDKSYMMSIAGTMIDKIGSRLGKAILFNPLNKRTDYDINSYNNIKSENELKELEYKRKVGFHSTSSYNIPIEFLPIFQEIKKIQRIIDNIPNNDAIVIYGENEHTKYLLNCIDLSNKQIIGVIGERVETINGYAVSPLSLPLLKQADKVIISTYSHQYDAINRLHEFGIPHENILLLYSDTDYHSFYSIFLNHGETDESLTSDQQLSKLEKIATELEKTSNSYVQYRYLPKKIRDKRAHTNSSYAEFGIIIQGPIILDNNFTLNTINLYLSMFPGCKIVLSTWKEDVNDEILETFYNTGITILKLDKPDIIKLPGISFFNYQLKSTYEGLCYLKNIGIKYAIKTRSDARIFSIDTLDILRQYFRNWPSKTTLQSERLIIMPPSLYGQKMGEYYYIFDHFMCGDINDMMIYWKYPREINYPKIDLYSDTEHILMAHYCKYLDVAYNTRTEFIKLILNYFIVLDIDNYMIWNKYNHQPLSESLTNPESHLTHLLWIQNQS